jgi:hypothetical protein
MYAAIPARSLKSFPDIPSGLDILNFLVRKCSNAIFQAADTFSSMLIGCCSCGWLVKKETLRSSRE